MAKSRYDVNERVFWLIYGMARKNIYLDKVMVFFSRGGIYFYWLIMLYLFFTGDLKVKFYLFKTGVVGLIAVYLAKYLGRRYYFPRPFVEKGIKPLYPHAADSSFPSDHITGAVALTMGIWEVAKVAGIIALAYVVFLMISRVYVGHHYLRDVLAGAFLGGIVYYLLHFVFRLLIDIFV
ncbi:phosphatase PAP2 family protein [Carboxydothermus hydrogenoformans]|uniref:PAP2 family protein n=1 Tax=Carboxydothermus hydrogenoformans (strain ATCC BAA-161 / DSM 6008 / Z-2901) TaxID=246194 RepID=Q3AFU9_CARHZ|nr:phosphatase PAP2 family protein [Carboxydothermus hydrogenoformans]ABB15896.1 PAP2 family protein [Carboxydothermus hydrogenoformans Z-2901]